MTDYDQPSPAGLPDATHPTVRVTLGDSLGAVRASSTVPIRDGAPTTGERINITTPTQLVYGPPGHVLPFPAGLFLSLVPMAGHVVEIRASPHLRALTLDGALELVAGVSAAAGRAGWQRVQVLAPPDSVRHAVASLPPDALYKQALAQYRLDNGDELYLSVQRTKSAQDVRAANTALGTRVPERDQFLVDVYLTNGPVFERYAAIDRARQ